MIPKQLHWGLLASCAISIFCVLMALIYLTTNQGMENHKLCLAFISSGFTMLLISGILLTGHIWFQNVRYLTPLTYFVSCVAAAFCAMAAISMKPDYTFWTLSATFGSSLAAIFNSILYARKPEIEIKPIEHKDKEPEPKKSLSTPLETEPWTFL